MKRHEQDRISQRDWSAQQWTSAQPAGPARTLDREEIERLYGPGAAGPEPSEQELTRRRAEKRMAQAAAELRLQKEIRAYARLDAINAAWEARGRK